MDLVWIIYLIDVICGDWYGFGVLTVILFTLSTGAYIVSSLIALDDNACESDKRLSKILLKFPLKTVSVFLTFILFISNFIPSEETAYKMLAAYGAQELANNPDDQEVFGEGLDILKLTLAEYKKELEN